MSPGLAPNPGPLTMDTQEEDRNTYIDEKIWRKWLKWFGLAESHELDRRNWASDDKQFEVCVLSPYSGVVQHPLKVRLSDDLLKRLKPGAAFTKGLILVQNFSN